MEDRNASEMLSFHGEHVGKEHLWVCLAFSKEF
jgi:hypothetical protein